MHSPVLIPKRVFPIAMEGILVAVTGLPLIRPIKAATVSTPLVAATILALKRRGRGRGVPPRDIECVAFRAAIRIVNTH